MQKHWDSENLFVDQSNLSNQIKRKSVCAFLRLLHRSFEIPKLLQVISHNSLLSSILASMNANILSKLSSFSFYYIEGLRCSAPAYHLIHFFRESNEWSNIPTVSVNKVYYLLSKLISSQTAFFANDYYSYWLG